MKPTIPKTLTETAIYQCIFISYLKHLKSVHGSKIKRLNEPEDLSK